MRDKACDFSDLVVVYLSLKLLYVAGGDRPVLNDAVSLFY